MRLENESEKRVERIEVAWPTGNLSLRVPQLDVLA